MNRLALNTARDAVPETSVERLRLRLERLIHTAACEARTHRPGTHRPCRVPTAEALAILDTARDAVPRGPSQWTATDGPPAHATAVHPARDAVPEPSLRAAAERVVIDYERWKVGEIDELWPAIDPLRAALTTEEKT